MDKGHQVSVCSLLRGWFYQLYSRLSEERKRTLNITNFERNMMEPLALSLEKLGHGSAFCQGFQELYSCSGRVKEYKLEGALFGDYGLENFGSKNRTHQLTGSVAVLDCNPDVFDSGHHLRLGGLLS